MFKIYDDEHDINLPLFGRYNVIKGSSSNIENSDSITTIFKRKISSSDESVIIRNNKYAMSSDKFLREIAEQKCIENFKFKPNGYLIDDHDFISVPYGVVIIDGGSATGKTTLLLDMVSQAKGSYITFGEPAGLTEINDIDDLRNVIVELIESGEKTICIDSVSDLLTLLKNNEAPGAGGVSNQFFSEIARMSRELNLLGVSLILVINYRNQSAQSSLSNAMIGVSAARILVEENSLSFTSRSALSRKEKVYAKDMYINDTKKVKLDDKTDNVDVTDATISEINSEISSIYNNDVSYTEYMKGWINRWKNNPDITQRKGRTRKDTQVDKHEEDFEDLNPLLKEGE